MIDLKVDTKQKILDTAEKLFSDNGIATTSLRNIIGEADVNLAAIHYHFKSKEALIEAVIMRRAERVNRERLEMLDACEAAAGPEGPEIVPILEAFLLPFARIASDPDRGGPTFVRLVGRMFAESDDLFADILRRHFGPVAQRFFGAFARALPDIPRQEVVFRLHFTIGALAHTMRGMKELEALTGCAYPPDPEAMVRRLISFVSPGFQAHEVGNV